MRWLKLFIRLPLRQISDTLTEMIIPQKKRAEQYEKKQ